jgi:glycosyltransferase involved in cell wall biosynthesis
LGFTDDIYKLLLVADVFVLASETEGLSCSVIEAMSSSLPVIATNVGGNSELIQHDISGIIVDDTGEPLINSMRVLKEDKSKRTKYGDSSLERFDQFFSAERMVQKYESLYDKIT